MISGRQIKLARTSLDWSQEELAEKTGLSPTTIYNLERGEISPRPATENALRKVFEAANIEFIEQDGIRHRSPDVTVFSGTGCAERFFDHMLETIKGSNGEVIGVFKTSDIFIQACDIAKSNEGLFKKLAGLASVKCLLPDALPPSSYIPPFQFRSMDSEVAESSLTYGNKHAIIISNGSATYRFVVIDSYGLALDNKKYFSKQWERAAFLGNELRTAARV